MTAVSPAVMPSTRMVQRLGTDYHTFLRCTEAQPWLERVEEQLEGWLIRKKNGWRVPLRQGGDWTQGHRTLRVRHLTTPEGRALRFHMLENDSSTGVWSSQLLAVERPGGGWIDLAVANDRGQFVDVPNIARWLVSVLPLQDGETAYRDKVWRATSEDVSAVQDLILDPERRSPVFVAGSDETLPLDGWQAMLDKWFSQTYGVGHAVLLEPEATARFNASMPAGGGVESLTIRTYLRGVADDDQASLTRHKFLGTKRLGDLSPRATATLLGRVARTQTARRGLHDEVQTWERMFTRQANAEIVEVPAEPVRRKDRPQPAPPCPPALSEVGAPLVAVLEHLGLDALDLDRVKDIAGEAREAPRLRARLVQAGDRLEQQEQRVQALEDDQQDLQDQIEDLYLEARIADDERVELQAEIRRLQGRLSAQGRAEEAYDTSIGQVEVVRPGSYSELLDAIAGLEACGVVFTGEAQETLELERIDTIGKCLGKAWDACLALADYVRAKQCGDVEQGVQWYLEHTPAGYQPFSARAHAHTETGETRRKHGDERMLPVPVDVSKTGRALMLAHFKLGRLARQDPRLYYLDDTARTGKVYIGYLGRHLTNTQT